MFETKSKKEVLKELDVDPKQGLSNAEAGQRLVKYGFNKLQEEKKKSWFLIFLSEFNDPMIYVLLGAALLCIGVSIYEVVSSGAAFDYADPIIILAVVFINAIIGTVQECKAEKSLEALKKMSSPTALVRREGKIIEIKAEELVPGDIVILEEGRTVPADLRIIEGHNLKTDESSLTGESLPVEKDAEIVFSEEVPVGDRVNIAYMSTPVVYGRGEGVVISTGMGTETGKIAKLLSEGSSEQTPLQKKLASLSKFLGLLTIVIVVVMFGIQLLEMFVISKIPSSQYASEIIEYFMGAISLAVAAIPEGLPAVVTIVLALGTQRMVKANAIVRKLPSVETLGSVSVVCSDKTGTLTQNKMTVVQAYINKQMIEKADFTSNNVKELAAPLSLCSNASVDEGLYGDPTEIALIEFSNHIGLKKKYLEENCPRIEELPFDSVRKMMSTKHRYKDKDIVITKGAMDQILKISKHILINGEIKPMSEKDKKEVATASDAMAKKALRVLAVAYKESSILSEDNLVFVGLVGMIDPPRPECKKAVDIFKGAGITTIMITGDHKVTALAIAKELGIAEDESQAMSGEEIDLLSMEELQEKVKTTRIFARVSPENKVSIVTAIKNNGMIVAMTGDGVNDAPSLKRADIGIAMGITGTDVAKGAADMVLTDDNFASIEKAVEEGRSIFTNIKKTVLFLLGSNLAEVLTMLLAVVLTLPTPLVAIHILWVNLVTDSLPAVALGACPKEPGIMKEKPRNPKESLFAKGGYAILFGYGILITICTLLAFLFIPMFEHGAFTLDEIKQVLSNEDIYLKATTMGFCVLALSELFHMLGMTSITKSFVHNFKNKNWLVWVSFLVGVALQIAVVEIPGVNVFFSCYQFDNLHWIYIFLLSIPPLVVHEIIVFIIWLKNRKHKAHQ